MFDFSSELKASLDPSPKYPHILSKVLSILTDKKIYWLIIFFNKIHIYVLGFWKWF